MVEITLPIILQIVQTTGILVGIIYYVTIMRNAQRTRELSLKAQEDAERSRQKELILLRSQSFANPKFLKAVRIIQIKSSQINSIEDFNRAYDNFNPDAEDQEFVEAFLFVLLCLRFSEPLHSRRWRRSTQDQSTLMEGTQS